METVKEERVSPLLRETPGSFCPPDVNARPCVLQPPTLHQPTTHKTTAKSTYLTPPPPPPPPPPPQQPPHTNALSNTPLSTVICTTTSSSSSSPSSSSSTTVSVGDLTRPSVTRSGSNVGGGGSNVGVPGGGEDGVVETVFLSNGQNFSGEISEAVSKILEDYDWSKIPLANKDAATMDSERRKVHVKRPMNAFMVWAQEARRKLSCSHRQVHNAELSKSLGRIWRGMTEDQKKPFIDRADHLRRKHKQEYPDYKYQPRRRKENVKTVGKAPAGGGGPAGAPLGVVQDMAANHHFVSAVKGGGLGLSLHPLSPPNSPSGQGGVVRTHGEGHLGETVFVPDCLADSFETIDRAEMNKYLLPDQGGGGVVTAGGHYAPTPTHVPHAALQPMTTTMSSMTASSSSSSSSTSSSSCSASAALTTLPPLGSRLLPSAPVYGSGSPYYTGGASPQPGSHGSPDITADIGGPVPSAGGAVSPGGSPGSPVGEFVELQPPRVPKEEPLPPPLMTPKHSNVTPFLHQNLCYSTQPYTALQYSYPYAAMWH